jgi:hypothetical protein
MDELLSRVLDAHGGLGYCAGLSGLTAAFPEYRGSSLLSLKNYFVSASKP